MHRRAGIEWEFANRTDQRVLRWFGHVERMDEYTRARMALVAEVSGSRVRGWRCEGGLGQQRNNAGGSATIHEKRESPGARVTE